ncbi:ketopantoate reductase family protein [Marinobacter salicampi]|uniref:ketopantoate reductase family protein n=1 Tax=Marinobacter salicampi TaxID=435907 RepID=UPI001F5EFCDC|nr:2-dehydropantoate 2-reductase [Marinobacter salicampi]
MKTGSGARRSPEFPDCLILGAGALGRLWAAHLTPGTVGFVPRNPQQGGNCEFHLEEALAKPGQVNVSVPWHWPSALHPPRLLLVTTKAYNARDALAGVVDHLPLDTPIVLFQNGMGSQDTAAETHPDRPILAAVTTEGANRPREGSLIHAGRGETWVGGINRAGSAVQEQVTRSLGRSGLVVHPEPLIRRRMLRKLVVNAGINPFTAILDCSNGAILGHPFYLDCIDALCDEASVVMANEGQSLPASEWRGMIEQVARTTAGNTSSMRADVISGRRTEIDFINGWLCARCDELGFPAQVNRMLVDTVKALSTIE